MSRQLEFFAETPPRAVPDLEAAAPAVAEGMPERCVVGSCTRRRAPGRVVCDDHGREVDTGTRTSAGDPMPTHRRLRCEDCGEVTLHVLDRRQGHQHRCVRCGRAVAA